MHTEDTLTAAEREALALLTEECAEVAQAACKALRHGPVAADHRGLFPTRYDNLELLSRECGDVLAAVLVAQHVGLLPRGAVEAACQHKLRRLQPYLHHIDLSKLTEELDSAD